MKGPSASCAISKVVTMFAWVRRVVRRASSKKRAMASGSTACSRRSRLTTASFTNPPSPTIREMLTSQVSPRPSDPSVSYRVEMGLCERGVVTVRAS